MVGCRRSFNVRLTVQSDMDNLLPRELQIAVALYGVITIVSTPLAGGLLYEIPTRIVVSPPNRGSPFVLLIVTIDAPIVLPLF